MPPDGGDGLVDLVAFLGGQIAEVGLDTVDAAKSEGNIRIARARHAATIRSDTSANTTSLSHTDRVVFSFPISPSSVSRPSAPGSAFSSANCPGLPSRSSSEPPSIPAGAQLGLPSDLKLEPFPDGVLLSSGSMRCPAAAGSLAWVRTAVW